MEVVKPCRSCVPRDKNRREQNRHRTGGRCSGSRDAGNGRSGSRRSKSRSWSLVDVALVLSVLLGCRKVGESVEIGKGVILTSLFLLIWVLSRWLSFSVSTKHKVAAAGGVSLDRRR